MKRIALFFAAVACTVSCQSCQNKDNGTPDGQEVALQVSRDNIEMDAEGGETSFDVTASQKPYIVGSYDWCRTSQSAFAGNKMTVTLTIAANKASEPRTAQLSVVCGDEKKSVEVLQKGAGQKPGPSGDFLDTPALPDNNAAAMAKKLGFGWNLGNQMDAFSNGVSSETAWGNPRCTQTTFDNLKAKGFSTVRIPVTWMGHIGEAPEYRIEEAWLDRVYEIAGYARAAGLNAIVNMHHDDSPGEGWLCVHKAAQNDAYKSEMFAKYTAVWKQIAEKFADEDDWLILEGYNELQDGGWGGGGNLTDGGKQYAVINELAQAFVNTVRETGGKNTDRYLSVLGYSASPYLTAGNLVLPDDKADGRLMVSVHFYDPSGYALGQNSAYTEWGHTGAAGKKDPNHGEENVVETFKMLKEKYIDNNIPLYIGECGAVNRSDARARSFQQYWFEFVFKAAKDYGMCPVVWDNGAKGTGNESFGFIGHADGGCINGSKPIIDIMNKAFNTDTQSYTLKSVYDNAPR